MYFVGMLVLGATWIAAEPMFAKPPATTSSGAKATAKLSDTIRTKYPLIRAVVVLRGDLPVFEYYHKESGPTDLFPVQSVTKSVISTLVGIAFGQGGFRSLDQSLGELLPEALELRVDTRVREVTIRHLLTMSSGFDETSIGAAPPSGLLWAWSLYRPLRHAPGRQFNYDNDASHLLSVLLTRTIKQDPRQFAHKYLFEPLGIEKYSWPLDSDSNLPGSVGLSLTARDMAKIGSLYLQGGKWHGRQLVPETYIAQASHKQIQGGLPNPRADYGYLWWVTRPPGEAAAYFASGYGGHYIYVVPRDGIVVAVAAVETNASGRRLINQVILPAVRMRTAH